MSEPAPQAVASSMLVETLSNMARGYRTSQAIAVAAELGLADLMVDGPRTVDDLAAASSTHAPSLLRLLRALASVGVFAETGEGRFGMTPLAEPLRSDAPRSVRPMARFMVSPVLYESWGQLAHSIRTGEPAFNQAFGVGMYEFLAQHPADAEIFNAGMAGMARHQAVLDAYDFGGARVIVDVGGGSGRLIAAILSAHSDMRGILYDLPEVVVEAGERLQQEGLAARCDIVGGSFLDSVPAGGDLYLLSDVLHNWDDVHAALILSNCRKAISEDGRLVVIQRVLDSGSQQVYGRFADLNMLVLLGGHERTADEFRALLTTTGFTVSRIVSTRDPYSVIEATPTRAS